MCYTVMGIKLSKNLEILHFFATVNMAHENDIALIKTNHLIVVKNIISLTFLWNYMVYILVLDRKICQSL